MFGFIHSYHHPDGNPLARLMQYYYFDPVGLVINNRMDICWGHLEGANFSSKLIIPDMKVFEKIDDESYNELVWTWDSEEIYNDWFNTTINHTNVKVGDEWMELSEIIGPPISEILGVTQTHIPPMEGIHPGVGMLEMNFEEILWKYKYTLV